LAYPAALKIMKIVAFLVALLPLNGVLSLSHANEISGGHNKQWSRHENKSPALVIERLMKKLEDSQNKFSTDYFPKFMYEMMIVIMTF
jgi:hypothetical protein